MNQAKIYVGNLPYNTNEDQLREFFAQYGNIEDIKLIVDFNTGRSKGFGFITFATAEACESAVSAANGAEMGGRKLKVNVARENNDRDRGGRSDRGGRGGRGGFGGGRHSQEDRY